MTKIYQMGVLYQGNSFTEVEKNAEITGVNYVEGCSFQRMGKGFNDSTIRFSTCGLKDHHRLSYLDSLTQYRALIKSIGSSVKIN